MSTKPGMTHAPAASTASRAPSLIRPISTMKPSRTPTSPQNGSPPAPSTTVPPRIRRSSMGFLQHQAVLAPPEISARQPAHDMPDAPQAGDDHHAEVGVELDRNDAQRQAGILHAAFDHDRPPVPLAHTHRLAGGPAEKQPAGVVDDDDHQ